MLREAVLRARPALKHQLQVRTAQQAVLDSQGGSYRLPPSTARRPASTLRSAPAPPFPLVDRCPPPTCRCAPTPPGLDIERKKPLDGTVAAYSQQVVICTGKDDWTSRIEDDTEGTIARGLKALLGRGGRFSDPFNNIMITNSSFPSPASAKDETISVQLFPSSQALAIPKSESALSEFVQAYLLPLKAHPSHSVLPRPAQAVLERRVELQDRFRHHDLDAVTVLVCGHGGRDERCGVMGPLLREAFNERLCRSGHTLSTDTGPSPAQVCLISHIGGHKFAGNVIIYFPPKHQSSDGVLHPLAGMGIWYGRMEPRHIEGIVQETIGHGRVIQELFRGGSGANGSSLRL